MSSTHALALLAQIASADSRAFRGSGFSPVVAPPSSIKNTTVCGATSAHMMRDNVHRSSLQAGRVSSRKQLPTGRRGGTWTVHLRLGMDDAPPLTPCPLFVVLLLV